MVPEHIAEVRADGRDYVIRSQPKGLPMGLAGASTWVVFFAALRRWARRDKTWVVQVRARHEDPFGRVLYQEAVGERDARERVEALRRELRLGNRPWSGQGA